MKRNAVRYITIAALLFSGHSSGKCCAESEYPETYILPAESVSSYDQKDFNTCWACSALGSVNIQLKNQGINSALSPSYLAYTAYTSLHSFPMNSGYSGRTAAFYEGGTSNIAASLMTSWRGILSENILYSSKMPETPGDEYSSIRNFNIKNPKYRSDYFINDIYNLTPWISEKKRYSTDQIKQLIYEGNSVSSTCSLSCYEAEGNCLNNKGIMYQEDGSDSYLHTILITGWDDSFSRMNFSEEHRPEKDGAWLAVNSYGNSWGKDGCFWISYEDPSLLEAVAYSGAEQNMYQNNYQHDYFGWTTSLSTEESETYDGHEYMSGKMANIFTAENDELISAVSLCTIEENVKYEISVCTGLTDPSDPESGTFSEMTSGCIKYPGYHTVRLSDSVRINQGEKFSVIVKLLNPSSGFTVPIEASIVLNIPETDMSVVNVHPTDMEHEIGNGESFVLFGNKWCDIMIRDVNGFPYITDISADPMDFPDISSNFTPSKIVFGNVCVKAFSTPYSHLSGDANDDGNVNASDIVFLKNILLSGETKKSFGSSNRFSDLDNDEIISVSDLISLVNIVLRQ